MSADHNDGSIYSLGNPESKGVKNVDGTEVLVG